MCTVNCKVPELTRLVNAAIVSVAEINRKNYHPGKFTFSCHCVRRWCSVIQACSSRSGNLQRKPHFIMLKFLFRFLKKFSIAPAQWGNWTLVLFLTSIETVNVFENKENMEQMFFKFGPTVSIEHYGICCPVWIFVQDCVVWKSNILLELIFAISWLRTFWSYFFMTNGFYGGINWEWEL